MPDLQIGASTSCALSARREGLDHTNGCFAATAEVIPDGRGWADRPSRTPPIADAGSERGEPASAPGHWPQGPTTID